MCSRNYAYPLETRQMGYDDYFLSWHKSQVKVPWQNLSNISEGLHLYHCLALAELKTTVKLFVFVSYFFKSLWACQFSGLLKTNASETEIEFLKIGQETDSFGLMQKKSSISAFFLYCSQFSQAWTCQCLLLVLLISNWAFSFVCSPSARGEAVTEGGLKRF